ncbi:MAG: HD domain-containing protein [Thermoplasmata archaeon]|nr:MAG: HD domain-containing protein [Thermoplasmata archaeon]
MKIPPPAFLIAFMIYLMHELVSFLMKAGKLKEIKRKGWLRAGIAKESVADHSYRVALIAMLVGDRLGMNVEKMMKMALLHDIAECITGDITPHDMDRERKIEKERNAMKELAKEIGMEYYKIWEEFVEGESKEAKILQEIDKVEMIMQAKEYADLLPENRLKEFMEEGKNIQHSFLRQMINVILSE